MIAVGSCRLSVFFIALLGLCVAHTSPAAEPERSYPFGYPNFLLLANEIQTQANSSAQKPMPPSAWGLDVDTQPFVRITVLEHDGPLYVVFISVGFIDLAQRLAHAKAIDKVQKGYYSKYLALIAETPEPLPQLPNISEPKFWTEDVMSGFQGDFEPILGFYLALHYAHLDLGHFEKYKAQIHPPNGKPIPINRVLTQQEFDRAFAAGAKTAMNNGYMTEGLITFLEAFDKMKTRPAWSAYFIPDTVKFTALKKQLANLQNNFFQGK